MLYSYCPTCQAVRQGDFKTRPGAPFGDAVFICQKCWAEMPPPPGTTDALVRRPHRSQPRPVKEEQP